MYRVSSVVCLHYSTPLYQHRASPRLRAFFPATTITALFWATLSHMETGVRGASLAPFRQARKGIDAALRVDRERLGL